MDTTTLNNAILKSEQFLSKYKSKLLSVFLTYRIDLTGFDRLETIILLQTALCQGHHLLKNPRFCYAMLSNLDKHYSEVYGKDRSDLAKSMRLSSALTNMCSTSNGYDSRDEKKYVYILTHDYKNTFIHDALAEHGLCSTLLYNINPELNICSLKNYNGPLPNKLNLIQANQCIPERSVRKYNGAGDLDSGVYIISDDEIHFREPIKYQGRVHIHVSSKETTYGERIEDMFIREVLKYQPEFYAANKEWLKALILKLSKNADADPESYLLNIYADYDLPYEYQIASTKLEKTMKIVDHQQIKLYFECIGKDSILDLLEDLGSPVVKNTYTAEELRQLILAVTKSNEHSSIDVDYSRLPDYA